MWTKKFRIYKLDIEKAEEPEIKLPTIIGSYKKQRNEERSTSVWLTMIKLLIVLDHKILWKILKEIGIPDHLTCLLRKLCADQGATVGTRHETTDWFKIGKGIHQGCILSSCIFNFYTELLFSHSVMSNPLWLHGLKHTRLLCPPPSSQQCLPNISSSVVSFSSCLQSFPASIQSTSCKMSGWMNHKLESKLQGEI